jgi:hypothetical protein
MNHKAIVVKCQEAEKIENFMLKFAKSNCNSNPVFPLIVSATQTEDNSNYNVNNDDNDINENPKRNDRGSNSHDDSSSDDPISYTDVKKRFAIKFSANGIVKFFRMNHKAIVVKG